VGAVLKIKKATGAKVAIHLKGKDSLEKGLNQPIIPINIVGKFFASFMRAEFKGFIPFKPDILIDNELYLTEFGIEGKIIHTPGHTEDSISIVLPTGEIFFGDMLFGGLIPTVPKLPPFAVSLKDIRESLEKLLSFSPKIMYSGHGGPFSPMSIIKLVNKNRKILS
jgi:glyoxylase-like metal-dependent hydrolase (beta-lactamase superfamily II)